MKLKPTMSGAILAVIAILVIGVLAVPFQNDKNQALDRQRLSQLDTLETAIQNFSDSQLRLPFSLVELDESAIEGVNISDFEYNKISSLSYELCSQFKTDTTTSTNNEAELNLSLLIPMATDGSGSYSHTAGRNCFDYRVDSSNQLNEFSPGEESDAELDDFFSEALEGFLDGSDPSIFEEGDFSDLESFNFETR